MHPAEDNRQGRARFLRDGRGCEKDADKAYQWYRRAYDLGKSDSVREGESWYRGALKSAEAGLARAEQEVSGKY